MKNSKDRPHPKADPQYWANSEHLKKAYAAGGEEGSVEAFRKLQDELPPIEKRHREQAAAYSRWNPGRAAGPQDATAPTSAPQSATK